MAHQSPQHDDRSSALPLANLPPSLPPSVKLSSAPAAQSVPPPVPPIPEKPPATGSGATSRPSVAPTPARQPADLPPGNRQAAKVQVVVQPRAATPSRPKPAVPIGKANVNGTHFLDRKLVGAGSQPISHPPNATLIDSADSQTEPSPEGGHFLLQWSWWTGRLEAAPAWLVSLIFHMALLLVLALISLPVVRQTLVELEIAYTDNAGEQLESFELSGLDDISEVAELALDDLAIDEPLATPPEIPFDLSGLTLAPEVVAPSIGFALTGREEGAKERLLAAYGGTAETEAAVRMGLEWLKRYQEREGTWRLDGPYENGAIDPNRTAATALALLAFQGAGHTHQSGAYRTVVSKGSSALVKMQDKDGNFFQSGPRHHRLYSHALATIAICELYGMTKDEKLREPAELALEYCVRSQAPQGGWRYEPKFDSDVSVTGWFVMALQSGRMAGLDVPSTTLENVTRFLDSAQLDDGSQYPYQPGGGPKISMTAEGLLCRQYLGWGRDDSRLVRGAEKLLENPIRRERPNRYYWYYATQVLHHMGGREWFAWNNVMREVLPATQVTSGKETGSWDPSGDPHDQQGGRLYTTCLSLFMLEVYYRHLPIYQQLP